MDLLVFPPNVRRFIRMSKPRLNRIFICFGIALIVGTIIFYLHYLAEMGDLNYSKHDFLSGRSITFSSSHPQFETKSSTEDHLVNHAQVIRLSTNSGSEF